MTSVRILVGTKKGAFILTSDGKRQKWDISALSAGAEVVMPIADQFWGDRYGIVRDPSGHQWSIGHHAEDLTPAQMQERMGKAFCG